MLIDIEAQNVYVEAPTGLRRIHLVVDMTPKQIQDAAHALLKHLDEEERKQVMEGLC